MNDLPSLPEVKKDEKFEAYEEDMKEVKQEFYNKFWCYKATLLKFTKDPESFFFLYKLPIKDTSQFVIKNIIGD